MNSSGWNFADVWEVAARARADSPALVHGDRRVSWRDFDRRADGLAATLRDAGLRHQDKVALYLRNGPEYLEAMFAAFKARLVPVNTNWRYRENELRYLWDNADAAAVVFDAEFAPLVERVRESLPGVRLWLCAGSGPAPEQHRPGGRCPAWAVPYEEATVPPTAPRPVGTRSGDDLVLLYTGGTTGPPKGVMWRQDDLFVRLMRGGPRDYGETPDPDRLRAALTRPGVVTMPAVPLMHGTGAYAAMIALSTGGTVVTLTSRSLDVEELLATVARERVTSVFIAGDAFARPLVEALDARPGRYDLSSVRVVVSSGVAFSPAAKEALLRHLPRARVADMLGASEALGVGQAVSASSGAVSRSFTLGPDARVVDEAGRPVEPGSGRIGRLAVRGRVPLGYYKDPDKTAATFPVIDGERWSIPGDLARVAADGTVELLGRAAAVINTGGEKVFAEEVEDVLRTHPAVQDAAVVGVPDARLGQAVTAVVQLRPGVEVSDGELAAHVKRQLAGYKAPRHVVIVAELMRGPTGKLDYAAVREHAVAALADVPPSPAKGRRGAAPHS